MVQGVAWPVTMSARTTARIATDSSIITRKP